MGDFSLVYLLCRLISSPHYFTIIGFNSHHLFLSANILLSFPLHSLWTALSLSIRTPRPLSPPLSISLTASLTLTLLSILLFPFRAILLASRFPGTTMKPNFWRLRRDAQAIRTSMPS